MKLKRLNIQLKCDLSLLVWQQSSKTQSIRFFFWWMLLFENRGHSFANEISDSPKKFWKQPQLLIYLSNETHFWPQLQVWANRPRSQLEEFNLWLIVRLKNCRFCSLHQIPFITCLPKTAISMGLYRFSNSYITVNSKEFLHQVFKWQFDIFVLLVKSKTIVIYPGVERSTLKSAKILTNLINLEN